MSSFWSRSEWTTHALWKIEPPRFEKAGLLSPVSQRPMTTTARRHPSLWQRFNAYFGSIPGQHGNVAYGVCTQSDGEAGPLPLHGCGGDTGSRALPTGFSTPQAAPAALRDLHPSRAHYPDRQHAPITSSPTWLPQSGHRHGELPDLMERYDERFDPHSGMGCGGDLGCR